jgi:branched-chain amino acid transport system ATP-binding protein
MSILELAGVTGGYGATQVLHGLALLVGANEAVAILGPNGAGKTSTLRAVSGTISRRGTILFDGTDISRLKPEQIAALGVAHVPQGRGTFPQLTVEENLQAGAYRLRRRSDVEEGLEQWYAQFPRLAERRDQVAGSLSGGEQQMLAIARAMMSKPRLLLLDEPSLGLAPVVTASVYEALHQIRRGSDVGILVVEQNASLALALASRAYVLEGGTFIFAGAADEVSSNDALRTAYLGV